MHVERAALQQVASLAADEGTGARGLVTILERTLRDHKYELPSSSIDEFTVTNATVVDPQAALRELLATQTTEHELELGLRDLKRFEKRLRLLCAAKTMQAEQGVPDIPQGQRILAFLRF